MDGKSVRMLVDAHKNQTIIQQIQQRHNKVGEGDNHDDTDITSNYIIQRPFKLKHF